MAGSYVKNFSIDSANTTPYGITTDGTYFFVVDSPPITKSTSITWMEPALYL